MDADVRHIAPFISNSVSRSRQGMTSWLPTNPKGAQPGSVAVVCRTEHRRPADLS